VPDIDLDLPSGDRRERVIQHVYERYGRRGGHDRERHHLPRPQRLARDRKVLGIPWTRSTGFAQHMHRFEYVDPDDTLEKRLERAGLDREDRRMRLFARLWGEIQDLPRHLGQHSGGW